jgi:hypothetical protein
MDRRQLGAAATSKGSTAMCLSTDLGQFHSTQDYHRFSGLFHRHLITDGVKYFAEVGKAYWALDAICSYHPKIMRHPDRRLREIQFWTLKSTGRSAVLYCMADSGPGEKKVVRQSIEFTDLEAGEYRFYVQPINDGSQFLILLPSEY